MKKKMEQTKNGKYRYEVPRLILSQQEIRVQVDPGETLQGELYFGTENEEKIRGYVSTSNRRLVPSVESFSGKAIQFPYGIDAVGMKPGEICEGTLALITSVGEYEIPFSIEARKEQMRTSVGDVTDLAAFGKLAKKNYREAFRLFTSPAFFTLLADQPDRVKALYRGMSHNPVTYQHLEEFLIETGQKEPVQISLEKDGDAFYELSQPVQETITLHKSGWGHFRLEVEAQGDFIQVQKRVITDDEFIGSVCRLEFLILSNRLGRGRRFGSIVIKGPYGTLEYRITASNNSQFPIQMGIFERKHRAALFGGFMDYQLGRLDFEAWSSRSLDTLRQMRQAGCDYPIYQIYEAYIHHKCGRDQQAQEILLQYQDKSFTREDIELAGGYLYLCYETGLLSDRWDLVERLERMYDQRPDCFVLLWVLMQADAEYRTSPLRASAALSRQFDHGCRSPLLYLEAFRQVEKENALLERMNPFWTQVMLFASKENLLTEELCMRIAYLSGYEKSFSASLYRVLTEAYRLYPSDDTLIAICKLIMKGDTGNKKYFPWFERAVEQNLRLTRLYECYIDSIDERYQQILPKPIRIYFAYNNSLSDNQKAFVYANVVRHRAEDPDVYENYRKLIREFAVRKLQEGVINEDFAVLYQELSGDIRDEEERRALGKMVFAHRLYCDDPKIRSVVVCQAQMKEETVYPCVKGIAYPRIYTEDAAVLFQDTQKRRYAATVDYNLRPLFDQEAVENCALAGQEEPGFLLYACCDKNSGGRVTADNLNAHQELVECGLFTDEFRNEIRRRLLRYYRENSREQEIDEYLISLDHRQFAKVNKRRFIELLIERNMLEEAYRILGEFGYEDVDPRALLKLCSRIIVETEFAEEDELLCLAYDVFCRGLYDEATLRYLMIYYVGPVRELIRIWECAAGFQIDTYRMEERILSQLVFAGDCRTDGSRVLKNYIGQMGQDDVIQSYLTLLAWGYFVHGEKLSDYEQRCLEAVYERGWELDMICRAALLKLHCAKGEWSSQQERQVKSILGECGQEGLYFAFFRKLPRELLAPYQLDDKVIVEYQGDPDSRVVLHYALDTGLGGDLTYKSEPLANRYHGYFNRTFTLFYGETLHYYFRVEQDGKEESTPEKTLTASVTDSESRTRYQMINRILAARRLGRNDAARAELLEYRMQEKLVDQLFTMMERDEEA